MNLKLFESLQFVITPDGRPTAIQISIEAWKDLLHWLEDLEDGKTVKAILLPLHQGPQRSGALLWNDIESEWDAPAE